MICILILNSSKVDFTFDPLMVNNIKYQSGTEVDGINKPMSPKITGFEPDLNPFISFLSHAFFFSIFSLFVYFWPIM